MKKQFIGATALALAILGGTYYGYQSYRFVTTDNATIESRVTLISSPVAGTVDQIVVDDNQPVTENQVLATLRQTDYKNALTLSKAQSAALAAQESNAEVNYKRQQTLFEAGATTQEKRDQAKAQYDALKEQLRAAKSQVNQSLENYYHTEIKAPAAGRIAKKSIEVGMQVTPGQPLIGMVVGNERWVIANFKETELSGIVRGKQAIIQVDALPGKIFHGVVDSISPSTGAVFSLLPPDNAVGNFTKVVQRVGVKITLSGLTPEDVNQLQAGLSAEVKIARR